MCESRSPDCARITSPPALVMTEPLPKAHTLHQPSGTCFPLLLEPCLNPAANRSHFGEGLGSHLPSSTGVTLDG